MVDNGKKSERKKEQSASYVARRSKELSVDSNTVFRKKPCRGPIAGWCLYIWLKRLECAPHMNMEA